MDDLLMYVGLKAFIEKDGKVLILNHSKGGYDLSGGKLKHLSDFEAELKREVKEETSLDVITGDPCVIWKHPYASKQILLIGFSCKWQNGSLALSDEHLGYEWIDENDSEHLPSEWRNPLLKYFKNK